MDITFYLPFFTNERVRNGLANARAKGKKIGRAKTRPSELIRALLKSGMSHRNIAKTLEISHGSVSLEKKSMKVEEAKRLEELSRKKNETQEIIIVDSENVSSGWY